MPYVTKALILLSSSLEKIDQLCEVIRDKILNCFVVFKIIKASKPCQICTAGIACKLRTIFF